MKRARRDNLIPAKMTTMASSMWQLKNKLQAHEIAMRISGNDYVAIPFGR